MLFSALSSAKSGKGLKGKEKTPEPEPVEAPEAPPSTPPPQPGSELWEYVDMPIDYVSECFLDFILGSLEVMNIRLMHEFFRERQPLYCDVIVGKHIIFN